MRPENRDPNASDRRAQSRMMHDLPAFVHEFDFFFSVAVVEKDIHLRQNVEGDGMRKNLGGYRFTGEKRFGLKREFANGLSARTRNRLVTRSDHPLDSKNLVQRVKGH